MYDTHNLYGMSEGQVTAVALQKVTKKRPFVLSRSGFIGAAAHTARWTGDNGATWPDLRYAMSGILTSGIFGAPMVGADICGFQFETTRELCERWAQVGAFYPFARSHSDIYTGPQEFYLWSSVAKTAMDVFYWRYRLLPFFYTLLYEASLTGAPIARPLFFQYPDDTQTLENYRQYLLGSAILVSPVLEPNQTSVRAYFPKGTWYNLFDMSKTIRAENHGVWETLPAAWDEINVHIRMGAIIPLQDFAMSTTAARNTPFTLLVALAPPLEFGHAVGYDDHDFATGEVFVDDDEQPTMAVTSGRASFIKWEAVRTGAHYVVKSVVTEPEYVRGRGLVIDAISVMGVTAEPFSFKLNRHGVAVDATFHANSSVLELKGLQLPLGEDFELVWNVLSFGNIAA
jgi:alpha-glucosidase (family GH31 glycosyl hydrolase)